MALPNIEDALDDETGFSGALKESVFDSTDFSDSSEKKISLGSHFVQG